MNKRIITIILALAAVCVGANAQPKEGGHCPSPIYSRDFSKMEVLDTTRLRVRYAFCAKNFFEFHTLLSCIWRQSCKNILICQLNRPKTTFFQEKRRF